jgi:hypothetical protein
MGCCEGQQFDKLLLIALKAPFGEVGGIIGNMIAKLREFSEASEAILLAGAFMLASTDLLVKTISGQE